MLHKLREAEEKYLNLEASLSNPSVMADTDKYVAVMKEYKTLTPIIEQYRAYCSAKEAEEEALSILGDSSDAELRALAEEELREARAEAERLYRELTVMLLPRDPNDEKNVIVELRAGAGGEEAALFAAELYRMYSMYAANRRFKIEVANLNETELGGIKEVSFMISGEGAYSRFKFESGVHRVQRVPQTETQGRVHTSAASVAVLPEADEFDIELNEKDIRKDTFCSSGPGGQSVNTTYSAIRLTHIPSGLVVQCQDEKSQLKNYDKALAELRTRLYNLEYEKYLNEISAKRKTMVSTGDRSAKIRTYNYPQGRITDHRIGLTIYKLEQTLNGDLDEIIDALITSDQAEKLKGTQNG